jgi:PAS domain S-box-containing protein
MGEGTRGQSDSEKRQRRTRYEGVVDTLPDSVAIYDESLVCIDVNRTFVERTGTPREALLGEAMEDVLDAVPAAERRDWVAAMERLVAGEVAEVRETLPLETERGDIYVEMRGGRIEGRDDELLGVVNVMRDVTERTRKARRLRRQNARIEALHDVATDIASCDAPEDVYERVVSAAADILDFDIAIVDAADGDVLVPEAVSSELEASDYYAEVPVDAEDNVGAQVYRSGESSLVEDLQTRDVSPASTEFRSALTVPIGDHGIFQTVDRAAGAFDEKDRELAELLVAHAAAQLDRLAQEQRLRDQAAELTEQNDRLEEFAGIVSHDLQNPLHVAEGYLELAREECDSDHLDTVSGAHERMETLVDDLLTVAREGDEVRATEPMPLRAVAEECWKRVPTDGGRLVVETERPVRADRKRLEHLLENLLRNAVEHGSTGSRPSADDVTERDGESVTVTVGDLPDGFYVADDGAGIPADDREDVFETGYTTAEDGTGLGLDIVSQVADAHGWSVRVTESEDGGARVEVTGVADASDADGTGDAGNS